MDDFLPGRVCLPCPLDHGYVCLFVCRANLEHPSPSNPPRRGLPYMTSTEFWDFFTLSMSVKSLLFVRKFGAFCPPDSVSLRARSHARPMGLGEFDRRRWDRRTTQKTEDKDGKEEKFDVFLSFGSCSSRSLASSFSLSPCSWRSPLPLICLDFLSWVLGLVRVGFVS